MLKGFLLAPLTAPAIFVICALLAPARAGREASVFLALYHGLPFSYVGFVALGLPLVLVLRALGCTRLWHILPAFALAGAGAYWFSLFYVNEISPIHAAHIREMHGWFGWLGASVVHEIFFIGLPIGFAVGMAFYWLSGVGRAPVRQKNGV